MVLPKPVSWTAHWLTVEGAQLPISENPRQTFCFEVTHRLAFDVRSRDSIHREGSPAKNHQLVKRAFSRQVYHTRLTLSLEFFVESFLSCSWNLQPGVGKELDPNGSVHDPSLFSGRENLLQCLRIHRDDPAGDIR